ncbi:MAG TPA: glycosyltransferase [Thermoanaerobaculia bacterium]|nr:glycosyltransferase [Thermoanaerobaculia bacterium]
MKITILAFGTRGDVQPIVALGKGLHARGHRVRVVAGANFTSWIASHGLEAVASSVDMEELMRSEDGQEWVENGLHPVKSVRAMRKLLDEHGLAMMRDAWRASEDADVLASSFTSDAYAVSIAEKLGARHVSIPLQPALVATRSGTATPQAPRPNSTSLLNYLCGKLLIEPFGWRLIGRLANRFRRETLGLPPQSYRENLRALRRMRVVQGFSRHVVPHPADWPSNIQTAGYWFLDESSGWEAPRDLLAFLEGGEPPIYIGFGSMTGRNAEGMTRLIIDAVARSGRRAILQPGWAGIGAASLPSSIHLLDRAPHAWLFPRVAAVVHHGGAGTTGEGLRAGVPTVIVPHMADQPFWGARVAALGVGPRPIPRPALTAEKLASAIREATGDAAMRARAAALGARIRAEDGIAAAAELIEAP